VHELSGAATLRRGDSRLQLRRWPQSVILKLLESMAMILMLSKRRAGKAGALLGTQALVLNFRVLPSALGYSPTPHQAGTNSKYGVCASKVA
jgi:hypothetical protein